MNMSSTQNISFVIAFFAGVLSFVSPCILPLVPAYIAYMAGISLKSTENMKSVRKTTFIHSIFFILGFSIIFILLGASITLLGRFLIAYKDLIRQVGGILVIIFGIYIMGILKLPFLDADRKIVIKHKPAGLIGSLLVGIAFAAGWTPCIGPILASILLMASTAESVSLGVLLLTFYSLGLGIPFILTSLAINTFLVYFDKFKKYLGVVTFVSGVFLIIVGFLLLTDYLQVFLPTL